MAGTTIKSVAFCLFLSLIACDCPDEKPPAPEPRQPGLSELSARLTWLGTERRILRPFLKSEDLSQKEIMEETRERSESPSIWMAIPSNSIERDDWATRIKIAIPVSPKFEARVDELIRYAAGLDFPENQITYHYTQHREARERAIILRAEGLGPNHPKILAARKEAATSLERAKKEASVFIKSIRLQQSAQRSLAAEIRPLLDDISNFPILQKKALAVDRAFREAHILMEEIEKDNSAE
jgi:hypothetical protein